MKIAAAAYPLEFLKSWDDYEAKMARWVGDAAKEGANVLVFPEYGAMELASLDGAEAAKDRRASLEAVARWTPRASEVIERLARQHGVYILAPSGPVWDGSSHRPVNRATFFSPDGRRGHQDKQIMTRFEREDWDVVGGGPLVIFETKLARFGVLICYDSEFPLLARSLAEAGAEVILVPSATEALAGYSRVKVGAMARALENQCVTVHSPVVGFAPWCFGMEENCGAAGLYGPPDKGFPATGVLAMGDLNVAGWTYGTVSLEAIRAVRADGGVLNMSHWPEQEPRHRHVTTERLG